MRKREGDTATPVARSEESPSEIPGPTGEFKEGRVLAWQNVPQARVKAGKSNRVIFMFLG